MTVYISWPPFHNPQTRNELLPRVRISVIRETTATLNICHFNVSLCFRSAVVSVPLALACSILFQPFSPICTVPYVCFFNLLGSSYISLSLTNQKGWSIDLLIFLLDFVVYICRFFYSILLFFKNNAIFHLSNLFKPTFTLRFCLSFNLSFSYQNLYCIVYIVLP